ncbi:hypothetical protein [Bradyrhizobium sp. cf659]|uniref:hypothetical protein n=1 Tax=Bradyrhizobium sp. cf659 TaxID=1761771 RepID=UPI0008F18AE8|nr:hypothetical protein [Bradyrhizobium sp. cf659]SFH69840.1 hypothetical protein SAMN04487925_10155 [Bradyrhizobium sp. cf659]
MGAHRDDILAEYYLRAAGVAAGLIGAEDTARLSLDPERVVYSCPRGSNFVLAYRLQIWKQEHDHVAAPSQAALGVQLEQLADQGGVGITPHSIAIGRAPARRSRKLMLGWQL